MTLSLPLLLRALVQYVESAVAANADPTLDPPTLGEGLAIVSLMTILSLLDTTLKAHAMYWGKLVGVGLRNITMRLIYTRTYTLSPRTSADGSSAGSSGERCEL